MDIMQIRTSFMRKLLSKLVSKIIKDKFGYKVNVNIGDLTVNIDDENAKVNLNVELGMNVNDLKTFTKFIEDD